MTRSNFICVFVIVACFNEVLIAASTNDEYQDSSIQARAGGRAYSVSSCNYKLQVGYSCLTCNRALHCYPGDIAILVDCFGPLRFCRDGRCSWFQGDKCLPDSKLTTPGPSNDTAFHTENKPEASSDATQNVVMDTADVTQKNAGIVSENVAETFTEKVAENAFGTLVTETVIIPIDDTSAKSDVSLIISDDASNNVV